MEVEQDLRTASDRVMHTLERLQELETEKRGIEPGTARFRKIAREVERLSASVFAHSHAQERLAEKSVALREQAGIVLQPIDDIEPSREIQTILAEWRDAERRMSEAKPKSAEHAQAKADTDRLRAEYRRTYQSVSSPSTMGRTTS
jgi:hypothetical protein